jgi:methyl-accepting chemotaxis protein
MFWRALSLRSKLLFLTLAGLMLLGIFSYLQVMRSFRVRESMAKNDFNSKAVMASQAIGAAFHERYMDVQAFANHSVLQGQNREAIVQTLNNYVESYKAYDALVLVDADGKFVASNSKTFDGKPVDSKNLEGRTFTDTPWFQRAVKNEYLEDKAKGLTGSVVEDVQIDSMTSALFAGTQYGMSFSRSVVNSEGRITGVLTARVSLRFVESELRGVYDALQSSGYRTGESLLINRDGLLLAEVSTETATERSEIKRNPDKILRWNLATQQGQQAASEALAGRSGSLVEPDRVDRFEKIWGYNAVNEKRFLDQLGWSVIVSASTDEVFADLLSQRRLFLSGFLGIAVVFGLFGYGLARNLAKEILEQSNKLRDECARLIELGEGLDGVLHKASHSNSENNSVAGVASSTVKSIFAQAGDCGEALMETAKRSRDFHDKALLSEHSVQRVAVEMTLARTATEQLSQFERELQDASTRLSTFSDFVFKAQLLGYNASIEANRAGVNGRGFASVAQDMETLVENATEALRELADGLNKSQSRALDLSSSIRRSVSDGETLMNEARLSVSQFQGEFVAIAESIETVRYALVAKEDAIKKVFDSVAQLDGASSRSQSVYVELNRGVQELREQAERIEDVIHDMSSSVRGKRTRSRGRRQSQTQSAVAAVFKRGQDLSPDQVRADAVDRLAQKMRPRLVVKSEDSVPEVTDTSTDDMSSRRVS